MRDNKWWLRGTKLVPRSSLTPLLPRGDYANAPPLLPLDPLVESNAVHNPSAIHIDEGRDDWFLGADDYLNENAAAGPPDDGQRDDWDWGSDDGGYVDTTMEMDDAAQVAYLDPGDLAASDDLDPFVSADGYEDPTTDLAEAGVGPVQANAPNLDQPPDDSWAWDDVVDDDWLSSDQAQDPSELAGDDAWPWFQDDVDDPPVHVDEPAGITLEALPYQDEWVEPELEPDDWWHALDDVREPSELASQTEWGWGDDDTGDDLALIVDDDDDAAGPDQPPMPVDDAWPWQVQDEFEDPPFHVDEPAGITLEALPYQDEAAPDDTIDDDLALLLGSDPLHADGPPEDGWPWFSDDVDDPLLPEDAPQRADAPPEDAWPWFDDAADDFVPDEAVPAVVLATDPPSEDAWPYFDDALPLDVVPSGYLQTDVPVDDRQDFGVDWEWSEDGGQLFVLPGGYLQADVIGPGPQIPYGDWHWDSDTVEDEWTDFIERIGPNGATGTDTSVAGDPRSPNLLRRRDDFTSDPPRDQDWDWFPSVDEPSWWPEPDATAPDFASLASITQADPWDHFAAEETEEALLDVLGVGPDRPVDPLVAGDPFNGNLIRRRDDFTSDPPRDHDWDFQLDEPAEEFELGSGPVVDAQVLFLEVPVEDAFDHFPPEPDNDWVEPSETVVADAPPALPRVSEEHDWKHFEDGEGDYEIEPSGPVDNPVPCWPDEWNWDEDGVQDDWWTGHTPEAVGDDFVPILGPVPLNLDWDFDGESNDPDAWWLNLPVPDTDGTSGPDLCPILLAQAYARIAELEAELAECRAHHGGDGGGGAGGDGDDTDGGHGHHGHGEDDEQRRILDNRERDKRARIDRNNNLLMAIVSATVHGLKKGPDK